jgi:hypothetical protein
MKNIYDSGTAGPAKKNNIQEDTIENGKALREVPAKDIRKEGERERKRDYKDERDEQ